MKRLLLVAAMVLSLSGCDSDDRGFLQPNRDDGSPKSVVDALNDIGLCIFFTGVLIAASISTIGVKDKNP